MYTSKASGLKVYSNEKQLRIEAQSDMDQVTINSLAGSCVQVINCSGRSLTADISSLSSGLYIAQIKLHTGQIVCAKVMLH